MKQARIAFAAALVFVMLAAWGCAFADSTPAKATVDIAEGKLTLDQFRKMWETEGKTPEGSIRCLLIAVLETVKEENPEGPLMWGMVLPKDNVTPGGEPDGSQRLAVDQFSRVIKGTNFRGAIAASYLGGNPGNGYQYTYDYKLVLDMNNTRKGDEQSKIFVRSGGKDFSSPVLLKKNKDGYWKIFEYSSLFTGVKAIESKDF